MRDRFILIGTSGWQYKHWKNVFYPSELPQTKWLDYYTKYFSTVEINNSFYRIPSFQNFENWNKKTPKNFHFAVKMNNFISRILKLKDEKGSTELFLKNAAGLKEKLSVVLVQLPPNFRADLERLENYLELVGKVDQEKILFAYEFRHKSWFQEGTYRLLRKYNSSLVIASSNRWPEVVEVTADFVYLRFHGPANLYGSNYPDDQLKAWAEKISSWNGEGKEVFAFFNNDQQAFAIKNALKLKEFLNLP